MADYVTLAQSAYLSQDQLKIGVVESILTIDQLPAVLPEEQISGNSWKFNREDALPSGSFIAIDGTITASRGTFKPVTAGLYILSSKAVVDRFIQVTRSNKQDQMAIQLQQTGKTLWRIFGDTLINGDASSNDFNGLANIIPTAQDINSSGSALTLDLMDQGVDKVTPLARPDVILLNSRARRYYRKLLRDLKLEGDKVELENYGRPVLGHDGIPIIVSDWIGGSTPAGAPAATPYQTDIYFIHLSPDDGLTSITSDAEPGLQIGPEESAESKLQIYRKMWWFCGLALLSDKAISRLHNVLVA
jgi:hypothetical protein